MPKTILPIDPPLAYRPVVNGQIPHCGIPGTEPMQLFAGKAQVYDIHHRQAVR